MYSVAFSPDGTHVAVTDGGRAMVLECKVCGSVAELLRQADAKVRLR